MNEHFEKLQRYLEPVQALQGALTLFQWDNETLAPPAANEQSSRIVGALTDVYLNAFLRPEIFQLLTELKGEKDTLSEKEKAIVRELNKEYENLMVIPKEEYRAFQELTMKAAVVWAKAREEDDFASFSPYLKEIVETQKRFAGYRRKEGQSLYDVLLSDYEPDFTEKDLDDFFAIIREELVPLVKEMAEKADSIPDSFLYGHYPADKQSAFCEMLAEYIGFEKEKGVIAQSAHPFTTNLHNKDVRITNHFYENSLPSAIFSVIHEGGHGIYEMGIADDLTMTPIGGGATMAMHESQSRFYENILGRSEAFWKPLYPKLQETYPEQLAGISLETFLRAINKSQPSLIRTEADELTYCLHILIRYELEKLLIAGELCVEDLPKAWKDKYREYLGIVPDTDREGVLQDTHWAWGNFGYFPSYAIGSAIGAQLLAAMKKDMDLDACLQASNLAAVKEYLGKHIHQYGKLYGCNELLQKTTGEKFNARYYVAYLREKYHRLYA